MILRSENARFIWSPKGTVVHQREPLPSEQRLRNGTMLMTPDRLFVLFSSSNAINAAVPCVGSMQSRSLCETAIL